MTTAETVWKPSGWPRKDVVAEITTGLTLVVTEPSGRSHTHGADDGRTGWRQHVVANVLAADAGEPAWCGLKPANGWGTDLFEDEMPLCRRCAVRLGACKSCCGSGRQMRHGPVSQDRPCETCNGRGLQPTFQKGTTTDDRL